MVATLHSERDETVVHGLGIQPWAYAGIRSCHLLVYHAALDASVSWSPLRFELLHDVQKVIVHLWLVPKLEFHLIQVR